MKWCAVVRLLYFAILFVAALFAAAPALSAVSQMWDAEYISGTVTSHERGFPRFQGMRDAPSGLFPSDRERPIGSLLAGIWALFTALQIRSLSWDCLMCLWPLFRHDSPWSSLASTMAPLMNTCGWHVMQASLNPTATWFASSDKRRPSLLMVARLASRRHVVLRRPSTWPCRLACHNLFVGLRGRYVPSACSTLARCVGSHR